MKRFFLLLFLPVILLVGGAYGVNAVLIFSETRKTELILEMRKKSAAEVYPAFAAQQILVKDPTRNILPLTGPSRSETVFCQENGPYLVYKSDRHGFHNSDEVWDQERWEAVFLGDSFVQGACVPSEENFVSRRKAVNLGSYGNGPLTQLASLMEYAQAKKPKTVYWVYMQNDLYIDLGIESESPILMQYLEGKTQSLSQRQDEIDTFLKLELEKSINEELREAHGKQFLKLTALKKFWFRFNEKKTLAAPQKNPQMDFFRQSAVKWKLYAQILKKASDLTRSWGGEMVFVLLPSAESLVVENQAMVESLKMHLKIISQEQGLHFLDLHSEMMRKDRPLQYYEPMGGYYGHFNRQGYQVISQFLKL